jgi:hypothetical protein
MNVNGFSIEINESVRSLSDIEMSIGKLLCRLSHANTSGWIAKQRNESVSQPLDVTFLY